MSIPYTYVELNTFNEIRLSSGRLSWRHWGIMDHEGIIINLKYLGLQNDKKCFLPAFLLKNLYKNFDEHYLYGGVLFAGDWYELIAEKYYTVDEIDNMYENDKGFIPLNYKNEEEGYPFLKPLLPELQDLNFLETLASDPTLNVELFYHALSNKFLGGNVDNKKIYQYRHPRWSEEWLSYCENIVLEDSKFKIIDKSNFLKLPLANLSSEN